MPQTTMKPKTLNLWYWTLTVPFALLMFMDGLGSLMRAEAGQEVMRHLGYPLYVLSIFGMAKVLGAVCLVQPWSPTLKEWAFAGFTINFIGAAASRAYVGDDVSLIVMPLVMLALLLGLYALGKKRDHMRESRLNASIRNDVHKLT